MGLKQSVESLCAGIRELGIVQFFYRDSGAREDDAGLSEAVEALCEGIRELTTVEFLYGDETEGRYFVPLVVYYGSASRDDILVSGVQTFNPYEPSDRTHKTFEVNKLSEVELIDIGFEVEYEFSSYGDEYKHGVICAVDRVEVEQD